MKMLSGSVNRDDRLNILCIPYKTLQEERMHNPQNRSAFIWSGLPASIVVKGGDSFSKELKDALLTWLSSSIYLSRGPVHKFMHGGAPQPGQ